MSQVFSLQQPTLDNTIGAILIGVIAAALYISISRHTQQRYFLLDRVQPGRVLDATDVPLLSQPDTRLLASQGSREFIAYAAYDAVMTFRDVRRSGSSGAAHLRLPLYSMGWLSAVSV